VSLPYLSVEIEDKELTDFLQGRLAKMEDMRPFLRAAGEHFMFEIGERFETETAPDGTPWAPLAPSTVANRARKRGVSELGILRETGRMRGTLAYAVTENAVSVGFNAVIDGTNIQSAALHHHGANAGRNGASKIPPRPILGMTPDDGQILSDMAETFLKF